MLIEVIKTVWMLHRTKEIMNMNVINMYRILIRAYHNDEIHELNLKIAVEKWLFEGKKL